MGQSSLTKNEIIVKCSIKGNLAKDPVRRRTRCSTISRKNHLHLDQHQEIRSEMEEIIIICSIVKKSLAISNQKSKRSLLWFD